MKVLCLVLGLSLFAIGCSGAGPGDAGRDAAPRSTGTGSPGIEGAGGSGGVGGPGPTGTGITP